MQKPTSVPASPAWIKESVLTGPIPTPASARLASVELGVRSVSENTSETDLSLLRSSK